MSFDSDFLDEACKQIYGHTDWEYINTPSDKEGIAVLFNAIPSEEHIEEEGEENHG